MYILAFLTSTIISATAGWTAGIYGISLIPIIPLLIIWALGWTLLSGELIRRYGKGGKKS